MCVNKVTRTIFCDKEGYDLVPFKMVSIIQEPLESIKTEEENTNNICEETKVMYVKDEISVCDKIQKEARERAPRLKKQWATAQRRTAIQVIKGTQQSSITLKPYIHVEIGKDQMTELALVDSRANINAISYETWEHIGKPPMEKSAIIVDTV